MKISYNWLKRYVDLDIPPEELAKVLTNCGLEVENLEKFETVRGGLKGVVIGKVMECTRHPNADKLSLTKVDIGIDRLLSVVCGAPNVAVGQVVPVATVGTILHQDDKSFEIREAKIRGEFSEGMICAQDELGLGSSHEGIMVLDPAAKIGMPAKDYFNVAEDFIFEIGLTPNRTDATSHIGVARDIVAVLNQRGDDNYQLNWPPVKEFKVDNHDLEIPVIVEDPDLCPRYSGVTITGVKIGESPAWMKNLLSAAGIRPINIIVDITNFVLMEIGQPLHAFDAAMITGKKVIARRARKGEKFITLDEVERELATDDLMICNTTEGMCIGGVFGGAKSGVTSKTTRIFLESAHFDPKSIRRTSRFHSLQTDASFRFERGSDPNITVWALKRAAMLIRELAGGNISSEIIDVYPQPIGNKMVSITYTNVNRLIGIAINPQDIRKILVDLGMQLLNESPDGLVLSVPTFKVDVTREADVIEEILRIYGYDNIPMPASLRSSLSYSFKPDPEKLRNIISDLLTGKGFSEIMNNSLVSSGYTENNAQFPADNNVKMLNPLSSDLGVMRQTILFGGLETIAWNQNRKINDLRIYEFGRVYTYHGNWDSKGDPLRPYREQERLAIFMTGRRQPENWRTRDEKLDFFDIKSAVHDVLKRLGFPLHLLESTAITSELITGGLQYAYQQKVLVEFGTISRKYLKQFDVRQEVGFADFDWDYLVGLMAKHSVSYLEIPKFPEVRRDLALLVDHSVTFGDLEKLAYHTEKHLLKAVNLFDVYEGENITPGKKSYALSFVLLDEERTLTDQMIEKTMQKLLKAFEVKFNATIR